ncbi:MAG TPA: prepilin-type N-terminal cleavage/methylation domain-containing protein [Pelomicrobium sp.]|nr:prepilin-type N-terminal cleavage/methylation domain-containing protein [Pelomicrobium sp.]
MSRIRQVLETLARATRGSHRCARPARLCGFTIIEALITVAILAVLAHLAIVGYQDYKERIKVAEAVKDILATQQRLENFYVDNRRYPDTLAELGGVPSDPWGRPYQYTNLSTVKGKGKARKDRNLVPINTYYDLWSNGPDGDSVGPLTAKASRDDIVRANDGRFVGRASDY